MGFVLKPVKSSHARFGVVPDFHQFAVGDGGEVAGHVQDDLACRFVVGIVIAREPMVGLFGLVKAPDLNGLYRVVFIGQDKAQPPLRRRFIANGEPNPLVGQKRAVQKYAEFFAAHAEPQPFAPFSDDFLHLQVCCIQLNNF